MKRIFFHGQERQGKCQCTSYPRSISKYLTGLRSPKPFLRISNSTILFKGKYLASLSRALTTAEAYHKHRGLNHDLSTCRSTHLTIPRDMMPNSRLPSWNTCILAHSLRLRRSNISQSLRHIVSTTSTWQCLNISIQSIFQPSQTFQWTGTHQHNISNLPNRRIRLRLLPNRVVQASGHNPRP